jgi:HK97 family phage major capsid protein
MNIKQLFALATANSIVKHRGFRVGRKDGVDPEQLKTALSEALQKRDTDLKALIEKAQKEVDEQGKVSKETKSALDTLSKSGTELQERLTGLEQEFASLKEHAGKQTEQGKTIGELFSDSTDFKDLVSKGRGTALVHVKAVTNVTSATNGTGGAGAALVPQHLPGILSPALRPLTIRDLIMPGRTSAASIEYVQESGFQNMAAAVAEGGAKPQSDLSLEKKTTTVKTLAHWLKASKQILADVPMLETYINTRLTYGLKYVEENQILAGDGTGENLLGLIPQATDFDDALRAAGDTKIDTLRRAILQVRVAEYRASGIVLNPHDWADIELTKDDNGRYIWVNVTTGGQAQLWRLPVVETNAMPEGDFMVGAFNMAAQVFDREDANVQVSTEDGDNFTKNMVTIRAEERLALAVYRPESFVYGPFAQGS